MVLTWAVLSLGGLLILTILVLWHLIRRGRLLRDRLGPPRIVQWPEPPELPNGPSPS